MNDRKPRKATNERTNERRLLQTPERHVWRHVAQLGLTIHRGPHDAGNDDDGGGDQ
jgi:hypothetical protein